MNKFVKIRLSKLLRAQSLPAKPHLIEILSGKTSISSSGYPYISERSFQIFLERVPHLFAEGAQLFSWLEKVEGQLESSTGFGIPALRSCRNALKVLKTVVQTAAVCAPPDLWILRQVLGTYAEMGILKVLSPEAWTAGSQICQGYGTHLKQLEMDFSLLEARGYLVSAVTPETGEKCWRISPRSQVLTAMRQIGAVPKEGHGDMAERLAAKWGKGCDEFLTTPRMSSLSHPIERSGWPPTLWEMELGFRLVPIVLALQDLQALKGAESERSWLEVCPKGVRFQGILRAAGLLSRTGKITSCGARIFQRGIGPFGIIHAYYPYTDRLKDLLVTESRGKVWVDRGKNVSASQSANRKTFELANASLDRFCADSGFVFNVFIEHALGQGEATRQRFQIEGQRKIAYVGADLEDAALDRAVHAQKQGLLPPDMAFIRSADIGEPHFVLDFLRQTGLSTNGAVMVVGNGFHEVRGQDDERIVQTFKGYCDAGIILIFTEESELSDLDLKATGWNTYHAGFRYTHQISGQGLRSAAAIGTGGRLSWPLCVEKAGYVLLKKYSEKTRTIYPHQLRGRSNPPISMNYFCVPRKILERLNFR